MFLLLVFQGTHRGTTKDRETSAPTRETAAGRRNRRGHPGRRGSGSAPGRVRARDHQSHCRPGRRERRLDLSVLPAQGRGVRLAHPARGTQLDGAVDRATLGYRIDHFEDNLHDLITGAIRAQKYGPELVRRLESVPNALLRKRLAEPTRHLTAFIKELLAAHHARLRVTDLDLAAFLILSAADGVGRNASSAIFNERLADELSTLWHPLPHQARMNRTVHRHACALQRSRNHGKRSKNQNAASVPMARNLAVPRARNRLGARWSAAGDGCDELQFWLGSPVLAKWA